MSRFTRRWVTDDRDRETDDRGADDAPDADVVEDCETVGAPDRAVKRSDLSMLQKVTKDSCHFLVGGMTGSGKTVWVSEFVKRFGDSYDRVYAIAGSARYNNDYDYLPKRCIFDPACDMHRLQRIVALQRKIKEAGKKYRLLLVFDDIVGLLDTHKAKYAKWFDRLITSGRHLDISCMFLTQRMTKISPTIRDNCRYVVVFRLPRNQIQDVVHGMQSDYGDKYAFYDAYKRGTQLKYSYMLLQAADPYSQCVHWMPPVGTDTGKDVRT